MITGNTDSEQLFALFLSQLANPHAEEHSIDELREALLATIRLVNDWSRDAGITAASLLNLAVTDGRTCLATRYNNRVPAEAATLFYSSGTRFECSEPGVYHMVSSAQCHVVRSLVRSLVGSLVEFWSASLTTCIMCGRCILLFFLRLANLLFHWRCVYGFLTFLALYWVIHRSVADKGGPEG